MTKKIPLENVPDAHDVAVAVVAVARVLDLGPESVIEVRDGVNTPSPARWYAFDLLCRGWPGCPRAWCARAVGYRQTQCSKVHRPKKASEDALGDVRAAWEALRAGSRPSQIAPRVEELPPFLPPQEASQPKLEAMPLPGANATKARLRAFLASVVANTGGVKA